MEEEIVKLVGNLPPHILALGFCSIVVGVALGKIPLPEKLERLVNKESNEINENVLMTMKFMKKLALDNERQKAYITTLQFLLTKHGIEFPTSPQGEFSPFKET